MRHYYYIKVIAINFIFNLDSIVCEEIKGNGDWADPYLLNAKVKGSGNFPKQIASKLTTSTDWIYNLIDRHNFYRQRHNSPKLKYNHTLCLISQAWADHLAETRTWGHNYNVLSRYRLGENIARLSQIGVVRNVNASAPVDLWYSEIKDYNFKTGQANTYGKPVGHFTQLVWRSTLEMGAALAIRRERKRNLIYVVANYYQQGNVVGKHVQNVLPPQTRKPNP